MRRLWIGVLWCLAASGASADESAAMLAARADWNCVRFQPIGVCRRHTPPYVGVKVRYWQPVLLVESVRRSGFTGIIEYRSMVSGIAPGQAPAAGGGSGCQADTTRLQFNEVHVFGFPFSDAFSALVETPCEGPPDLGGLLSYLSEQDRDEWRTGRAENSGASAVMTQKAAALCGKFGPLLPALCVGSWGTLYPRTGFSVHVSDATASALAVFRAVDAAALKWPLAHRVVSPLLFSPSVRDDRLQLVSPVSRPCMKIGTDPAYWERGTRSIDGRYVWIYWRKKECCLF